MSDSQVRVLIIGAGLSGLCLANALLKDPAKRFNVTVFERDDLSYSSDRGGYQVRLGEDGITGLRDCLDVDTYGELRDVWGSEMSRAPAMVDPKTLSILVKLNTVKLYPKSRAVPRSALKDFLMRKPMQAGVVRFSQQVAKSGVTTSSATGRSEVWVELADETTVTGDLLIAADGSRSSINRHFGLNNSVPLPGKSLQGRGDITRDIYNQLPPTLLANGSLMGLTKDVSFFTAVYERAPSSSSSKAGLPDPFLFWGVHISAPTYDLLRSIEGDQARCDTLADELVKMGCDPEGLPRVVRLGNRNVKFVSSGTSKPPAPEDWRSGKAAFGRVIFVGDSIHAMTPARGQGANQAMKDASQLAHVLTSQLPPTASSAARISDQDALALALTFDAEMYKRAFGWVKASEDAGEFDSSSWKGYAIVVVGSAVFHLLGFAVSALELVGLRRKKDVVY